MDSIFLHAHEASECFSHESVIVRRHSQLLCRFAVMYVENLCNFARAIVRQVPLQ